MIVDYENGVPGVLKVMFQETPDTCVSVEQKELEETAAKLCAPSPWDEEKVCCLI